MQPALCARLHQLVIENRSNEALVLQQQLIPLAEMVTSRFGVPGLKAAMDLIGVGGGDPRFPLRRCTDDVVHEVRTALTVLEASSGVSHSV